MTNKMIIYIVIVVVVAVGAYLYTSYTKQKTGAEVMLFLDHAVNQTLSVKIIVDDKVVFSDKIEPETKMPPLAFSKKLVLSIGEHSIKFEDSTRQISEARQFQVPVVKTIFVETEKDAVRRSHIVLEEDKVYAK